MRTKRVDGSGIVQHVTKSGSQLNSVRLAVHVNPVRPDFDRAKPFPSVPVFAGSLLVFFFFW